MNTYNETLDGNAMTVAQFAIQHAGALSVFTKYGIDYCCGGHRSLEEACGRIGLNVEDIKAEIFQQTTIGDGYALRPETWSSAFLADFIVENHHAFVKRAVPELEALLDKVCERHGNDSHELY